MILPQFPVSSRSKILHICSMSFSEIFPISFSLYITNSDLLKPFKNLNYFQSTEEKNYDMLVTSVLITP